MSHLAARSVQFRAPVTLPLVAVLSSKGVEIQKIFSNTEEEIGLARYSPTDAMGSLGLVAYS